MKILLVEDHRLVADAMQVMLQELEPNVSVSTCYSSQHALAIIDEGEHPDLILTDLFMPGIDGIGLLVGIKHRASHIPVVVISGAEDDKYIRAAIDNGAAGYINKSLPAVELLAGLQTVLEGNHCFPDRFETVGAMAFGTAQSIADIDNQNRSRSRVGNKQLQVLKLMAAGNSNKQISQIVGISESTVKYHTSQLFKTLNVRNRTSCIREAVSKGYLDAADTAILY